MSLVDQYSPELNTVAERELTQRKLEEVKLRGYSIVASDWDETVYGRNDPTFKDPTLAIRQIYEFTRLGIIFLLASARHTTFEIGFRDDMKRFCAEVGKPISMYRSGGNGMNLSKVTYGSEEPVIEEIYSNFMFLEDVEIAIEIYRKLLKRGDVLKQTALDFFRQFIDGPYTPFLTDDLMPRPFFELAKPFEGKVLAEGPKASFVLPENLGKQTEWVDFFSKQLRPDQSGLVLHHDSKNGFLNITRRMEKDGKPVDGKLQALETVLRRERINITQAVAFGDEPEGNDRGLVRIPYGFTNADPKKVIKSNLNLPPYLLGSSIQAVHKAMDFLRS